MTADRGPLAGGLILERGDGGKPVHSLTKINQALAVFGTRVWQRDLSALPADVRALLDRHALAQAETEQVLAALALSREDLVDRITEARGAPHVPGGGVLVTEVINHGYSYPQFFVVEAGTDYSRFDRFHVNTTDDGTGVDEIMQVLSGGGVRILQQRSGTAEVTLTLDCRQSGMGWIVTYDGAVSHIGSFSKARPGTKILMQVIGPERWSMRYDDPA